MNQLVGAPLGRESPLAKFPAVPVWPRQDVLSVQIRRGAAVKNNGDVFDEAGGSPREAVNVGKADGVGDAEKGEALPIPIAPGVAAQVKKKEYLVVDSGAFIRSVDLGKFEFRKIAIPNLVLKELKDKKSQFSLATYTYNSEVEVVTPSEDALRVARRFARESGDLKVLSETDLGVIACTYMLQKQCGAYRLRDHPIKCLNACPPEGLQFSEEDAASRTLDGEEGAGVVSAERDDVRAESEGSDSTCNEDEDSDGEWITQDNFHKFEAHRNGHSNAVPQIPSLADCEVVCVTTDYAVQNVLMHMGCVLYTVEGFKIESVRTYIAYCRACSNVMNDSSRLFCSECGHSSVLRVPVSTGSDGVVRMLWDKIYKPRLRGTVYSVPRPAGGRDGVRSNLLLTEDQMYMPGFQKHLKQETHLWKKSQALRDPFNPDVLQGDAFWAAKKTGTGPKIEVGYGRGNPNSNAWRKKHNNKGHRKKVK